MDLNPTWQHAMSDSLATTFIYEEKKSMFRQIWQSLQVKYRKLGSNLKLLFNSYYDRIVVVNINASEIEFWIYFRRFTGRIYDKYE